MKLLNFIFVTDTHLRASNPRSRIDDYSSAILKKMEWVIDYAIKREVDVIIHGGDVFDGYDSARSVEIAMIKIVQKAKDYNIPIISTIGSHDVHGYATSTIGRASIGIFDAYGGMTFLDRGESINLNGVEFVGCPHTIDLDQGNKNYYIETDIVAKYRVLIAHGSLVDHQLPNGFEYTLLDNAKINADMVLSGHYHPGHGIYHREDGKVFINPGALARVKATPNNYKRAPSIAYVEIYDNAPPHTELVKVKVAEPGSKVFNDDVLIEEPPNNDVAKMVEHLKQRTDWAGGQVDVEEAIKTLPLSGDINVVRDARIRAITVVQQEVNDG